MPVGRDLHPSEVAFTYLATGFATKIRGEAKNTIFSIPNWLGGPLHHKGGERSSSQSWSLGGD
ncbi:MAG: hypothetical protein KatS3mg045_1398 [Bellilinea sp.]|nr:MAG: hypothetical protein KatS3mg045_1398 [Bellilinea sp.]